MPDTDLAIAEDIAALVEVAKRSRRKQADGEKNAAAKTTKPMKSQQQDSIASSRSSLLAEERAEEDGASVPAAKTGTPRKRASPAKKAAGSKGSTPAKKKPAAAAAGSRTKKKATPAKKAAAKTTAKGKEVISNPRSTWALVAFVSSIVVVLLAALGWQRMPERPSVTEFVIADDIHVPERLMTRWMQSFPRFSELCQAGNSELLASFGEHLRQQPSVAEVDHVLIEWDGTGSYARRVLSVDLQLRVPVLPVRRISGKIDWVDNEGRVLPGELTGPEAEPRVVGIEQAGQAALLEVLEVWPQLKSALVQADQSGHFRMNGPFITRIHLDGPLNDRGDRGIVFHTAPGLRLIWGKTGEDRYGVDTATKITNFIHTLTCQGSSAADVKHVTAINVRFPDPFAVIPGQQQQQQSRRTTTATQHHPIAAHQR